MDSYNAVIRLIKSQLVDGESVSDTAKKILQVKSQSQCEYTCSKCEAAMSLIMLKTLKNEDNFAEEKTKFEEHFTKHLAIMESHRPAS